MSLTVCALLQGLRDFKPNRISGVILNQVKSPQMAEYYQKMIEAHTGLRVYGYLPPMPEVSLESRHLGLVTAAEVSRLPRDDTRFGGAGGKDVGFGRLDEAGRNSRAVFL